MIYGARKTNFSFTMFSKADQNEKLGPVAEAHCSKNITLSQPSHNFSSGEIETRGGVGRVREWAVEGMGAKTGGIKGLVDNLNQEQVQVKG